MKRKKDAHVVKIICGDNIRELCGNPGHDIRSIRSARGVRFFIDGKEIRYVKNATLFMPSDDVIRFEIEFCPHSIDVLVEGADVVKSIKSEGLPVKSDDDKTFDMANLILRQRALKREVARRKGGVPA